MEEIQIVLQYVIETQRNAVNASTIQSGANRGADLKSDSLDRPLKHSMLQISFRKKLTKHLLDGFQNQPNSQTRKCIPKVLD